MRKDRASAGLRFSRGGAHRYKTIRTNVGMEGHRTRGGSGEKREGVCQAEVGDIVLLKLGQRGKRKSASSRMGDKGSRGEGEKIR